MTLGLILTAIGVYLHLFVEPQNARWVETTTQQIVTTRAAPRRDPSEFQAAPMKQQIQAESIRAMNHDPDFATVKDVSESFLLKQTPAELKSRHLRFPSVQDRVRLYMSNWYTPPCPGNTEALIPYRYTGKSPTDGPLLVRTLPTKDRPVARTFRVGHEIEMARLLSLDRNTVLNCTGNEYCVDTILYWVPALDRAKEKESRYPVPTLAQFGDSDTCKSYDATDGSLQDFPQLPYVMKFRFRFQGDTAIRDMTTTQAEGCLSGPRPVVKAVDQPRAAEGVPYYQPVVWRLTSLRHFGMMDQIPAADRPWSEKKDAAVWRGALTGIFRDGFKLGMAKSLSEREICMKMHRCRLALQTAHTPLVDAMLTGKEKWVSRVVDGVPVYGEKYSYEQMLEYKAIIMLEGNDISSGFKWALYSNSVVLTEPPTKTSWAMEELLEPWKHYVPLNADLSDVEEKMQWVLDHPEEAQRISHQGSLWVQDLLYHPDAAGDEEEIYDEMIRRYKAHFVYDPTLSDGSSPVEQEKD